MAILHYETRPDEVQTVSFVGTMVTILRSGIVEVDGGYECEEIEYLHREPITENDYGPMVTAIIRSHYSADEMEAILNNYVYSKTAEHKAEWNTMQAWRTEAKRLARLAINELQPQ